MSRPPKSLLCNGIGVEGASRARARARVSGPRVTLSEAVRGDAPVRMSVAGDPVSVAVALRELIMSWPIDDTPPDDLIPTSPPAN